MKTPLRNLLFDLDGTLTDPQEGITRCLIHALERLGLAAPAPKDLLWCIGPPLHHSFAQLLGPDRSHQVEDAVAHYRSRFGEIGMFENAVFPGIPETLARLEAAGFRLFVATSKPTVFAEPILRHFTLHRHFIRVHGSELCGIRADKGELLAHLLETERLHPAETLMIGDRSHDVVGAKKNGIAALGVLWGYGGGQELAEAGAAGLLEKPEDLLLWLKMRA